MNGLKTLMQYGVSLEVTLFWKACVLGLALGLVFEVFHTLRRLIKHCYLAVFLEDFVYCLFFSFIFYFYSQMLARGDLRFFILFGMIIGFAVERASFGALFDFLVLGFLVRIKNVVFKIIKKIFIFIGKPIKKLLLTPIRLPKKRVKINFKKSEAEKSTQTG